MKDQAREGGFGVVLTDVFLSATATLLIVLALARPNPPVAPPIRADLLARCGLGEAELLLYRSDEPEREVPVRAPEDLPRAVASLEIVPRLFTVIGLAEGKETPLTATCLRFANQRLVAEWNRSRVGAPAGEARGIYGLRAVATDLN